MNRKPFVWTHPLRNAAVVLTLVVCTASTQPTRTADAAQTFDAAMIAYEHNH